MFCERKSITLRDGREAVIGSPLPSDAAEVLSVMRATSDETDFMARYSDEISLSDEDEAEYIRHTNASPQDCLLGIWVGGELTATGGVSAVAPGRSKYAHRAQFGMAALRRFWHAGIGSALMEACIDAARSMGFEYMELEAADGNSRAIALYERFGFVRCGLRPRGFRLRDGSYMDEILMYLTI